MKFKKRVFLTLVAIILIAAAALPSLYFYKKYQESKKLLENPSEIASSELKATLDKISKLVNLPQTDETPTLATITDVSKLQDQEFFKQAQNGDKLVVYTSAKKAYLFRPSLNKLVDVTIVVIGDQNNTNQTQSKDSTPSASPTTTEKK